jgi:bacterial/archaeal transporter family-2 protein
METLAVPFLLLVGALLALQAGANVQLATAMAHPFGASALQLTIGAALLTLLAVILGGLGALATLDDVAAWHLIGGLGSAVYITAGILLFPRLGAILTVALFIAGQMLVSLALDTTGWLGVSQQPLGPAALVGAAAVATGTALIAGSQADARPAPGWAALGLAAGAALPLQGAVNAQLRADLDAPVTAGAWSFAVAAAAMVAVLAVTGTREARVDRLDRVPWWGWLGGLCGAAYVTSVFLLIPEIGVAPTIGLTVAGQQIASILVDRYGLLRLPRRPIARARLAGVASLLAGVALIHA